MTAATAKQIGAIHAMKARARLDDATYRAMLESMTGKRSSKDLTLVEAGRVIDRLKQSNSQPKAAGHVPGLDTPLAKKLRALWIAGWNLGIVEDRTDRALLAFVERQTGVSHTRFLANSSDGSKAVEGLKAWLVRDGGVKWYEKYHPRLAKVAVIEAQWRRYKALKGLCVVLFDDGAVYAQKLLGHHVRYFVDLESDELDLVSRELGKELRGLIAAGKKRAAAS